MMIFVAVAPAGVPVSISRSAKCKAQPTRRAGSVRPGWQPADHEVHGAWPDQQSVVCCTADLGATISLSRCATTFLSTHSMR